MIRLFNLSTLMEEIMKSYQLIWVLISPRNSLLFSFFRHFLKETVFDGFTIYVRQGILSDYDVRNLNNVVSDWQMAQSLSAMLPRVIAARLFKAEIYAAGLFCRRRRGGLDFSPAGL